MATRKMTNVLLLLIFLVLVVMTFARLPIKDVSAETLRLDSCITSEPYDKPQAYVHVVTHDVSPIQSERSLK